MAERLGEVADLPPVRHVVLLREQPEVVGQAEEALEQLPRFLDAAVAGERIDQPEGAGQELSLVARQPVVGLRGRVAGHEPVPAELARDRVDGAGHTLVGSRQEPDERDVQDAGVQFTGAVVLGERVPLGVVAALADLRMDLVADLRPAVQRRLQPEPLGDSYGAVEDDPRHHLRVRVVPLRPAGLPDPVVGTAPDRLDVLHDRAPARPQAPLDLAEALGADVHDGGDLSVDVQLELLGGGIPDPDGARPLIAREVRELELGQAPLAADAVHDLDRGRVSRPDTEQEVAERQRLVRVAGIEQRLQREDRVAQPAVAVVPVAHAAELLRQ